MLFCYVVVVVLWCVCCVVFCLGGVCFARFFCGLLYESPGGNQVDGLPPVLHDWFRTTPRANETPFSTSCTAAGRKRAVGPA